MLTQKMKNRLELKFIVVILNQLMTSQDEVECPGGGGWGTINGDRLIETYSVVGV